MSEATPTGESNAVPNRTAALRITAREWLLLAVLASIQFTHIVDFMIVMPLGPVYRDEMHLTPRQFGHIVAAYTFSAGLAGLLAARFLDRFGRKNALLALYAGFTGGTLLCAVATDYVQLLAARTVAGAFGGVAAALVLAIVGDVFQDKRRGTATGIVMSAFSVASIVGVPLGLVLAEWFSWHAPFVALGASGVAVLMVAVVVLPPLRGHLCPRRAHTVSTWAVLADANHLRAFALTAVLVMSSFLLAPHMATFLESNAGLRKEELKYVYLFGGAATLVTMTWFGRLSDRLGKLPVFRVLALFTLVPVLLVTNLPAGLALPVVLVVTTLYMVVVSGRMVPATALITNSSAPAYRGSFMSLNAAVQHFACALAASASGELLTEAADGTLEGYWLAGVLACVAGLASVVLAGRLRPVAGGTIAVDPVVAAPPSKEPAVALATPTLAAD